MWADGPDPPAECRGLGPPLLATSTRATPQPSATRGAPLGPAPTWQTPPYPGSNGGGRTRGYVLPTFFSSPERTAQDDAPPTGLASPWVGFFGLRNGWTAGRVFGRSWMQPRGKDLIRGLDGRGWDLTARHPRFRVDGGCGWPMVGGLDALGREEDGWVGRVG